MPQTGQGGLAAQRAPRDSSVQVSGTPHGDPPHELPGVSVRSALTPSPGPPPWGPHLRPRASSWDRNSVSTSESGLHGPLTTAHRRASLGSPQARAGGSNSDGSRKTGAGLTALRAPRSRAARPAHRARRPFSRWVAPGPGSSRAPSPASPQGATSGSGRGTLTPAARSSHSRNRAPRRQRREPRFPAVQAAVAARAYATADWWSWNKSPCFLASHWLVCRRTRIFRTLPDRLAQGLRALVG